MSNKYFKDMEVIFVEEKSNFANIALCLVGRIPLLESFLIALL